MTLVLGNSLERIQDYISIEQEEKPTKGNLKRWFYRQILRF